MGSTLKVALLAYVHKWHDDELLNPQRVLILLTHPQTAYKLFSNLDLIHVFEKVHSKFDYEQSTA